MKRRILAVILLVLMLIPLFSLTVYAFPFNEFKREDHTLDISILYDSADNEKYIVADGLMLTRTIEYQGSKPDSGRAIYTQTARLEIALPDGYFDYAKYSYKTDPDKYVFNAGESETWFNQYAVNSVDYGIYYTIKDVTIYQVERYGEDKDKTVAELMEREVDKYRNRKENESNQADDPFTIRAESDGYSIILHYQQPTVFGARSDGLPISAGYDVFDCVSDEWTYIRFMSFPELPGIFMKAIFTQKISKTIEIEDESNKKASDFYPNDGDWQPHYNNAIERIEGFLKLHLGERFLDMASRVSITWNDPVISDEYGKTENEEKPPVNSGITQNAEQNPGEDSGVSVPVAIVIGVAGGGAAIVGAAAVGDGGAGDDRKKSYKMYIQKDFGDAIRRGADKPSVIRARMAEVSEFGQETDRDDLTAKISVSADGMAINGVALAGRYIEATVSVPAEYQKDTATISFVFTGEGGTFTNNVVFRIVDGPSLKFVDERDGTLYHENCGIDAIPGDGFIYTERFAVVDAPVAPKLSDISAVNTGEFDVEFALTDQPALYRMTVKNNTKPEPEHDIFAKAERKEFEIHVIVEGEKEPLKGYVTLNLYPEGITVQSRDEGKKNDIKYVRVQSYEKDHVGDLDRKWQVSEMQFTLAVKGKDKAIIDPKQAQYKFEKIKGAGGKGAKADEEQAIADKYEYKESYGEWNEKFTYTFEPNTRLWEPTNNTFFMILLPMSCEYNGQMYQAEVPMRLRGKDIDPMEAWEKEYEKTKERIRKFSLPDKVDYNLKKLEEIAIQDTCRISTWELRLMSKDILRAYMAYWTTQHEKDQWTADALDWAVWGLEWVKWIGDCAFSYVVAAYTGPLEAIITPAKDVLVNALGEVGVNIVWGTKFDVKNLEIYDNIKNAGDNFMSGGASDGISWLASSGMSNPAKIKYACAILGAYFAFAVLNNYLLSLEKGENDFYGAIMGAFKDLTVTAVKIAASMLFKQWLESASFKEKIGPKIQEFMQKWFGDNLKDQKFNVEKVYNESQQLYGDLALKDTLLNIDVEVTRSGIAEKYLTELLGTGAGWIYDNPEKAQKRLFRFNPAGELIFTFGINLFAGNTDASVVDSVCEINISKALSNTSSKFFSWLYDLFFGGVPVADSVIELPKDPPLPPAKN
ncbi:MAG: hypothetical protein IJL30_06265 [Clostridia bacterium]|nr:hypothetical protein [Clostridia bacterium]